MNKKYRSALHGLSEGLVLMSSFRALRLCFCLRVISFGDYGTVRRRASTGPSREGRNGPLLQLLLPMLLLLECLAIPVFRAGGGWAHSDAVRSCPDPLFGGPYMQHRIISGKGATWAAISMAGEALQLYLEEFPCNQNWRTQHHYFQFIAFCLAIFAA